jgi:hypothetical protein
VTLTVSLVDRSDVDANTPEGAVLDTAVDLSNGLEFIGNPQSTSVELRGLFSGQLAFVTNMRDFDFAVSCFRPSRTRAVDQPRHAKACDRRDRRRRRDPVRIPWLPRRFIEIPVVANPQR